MKHTALKALTTEEVINYVDKEAAPIGVKIHLNTSNQVAAWYYLRDVNQMPAEYWVNDLKTAYRLFYYDFKK